ncbi:uncharacterized protein EI90DRAFT_3128889 [Cantharellus anzutake]|uniref:uncharacterized protein n=1 Tax=Cantharellus anzutake TaxID=1750568 RepID=UPI0019059039|nr:uncharacterized protein EI90DRAFT_3128889 [Cantharellus anzutake]KAF8325318.1 hypothetical protein EI90DRAFT_3128889 [Cantharellus anzutake]
MSQKQYPSMNRAATERGLASSTSKGTGHVAGNNTGQPSLVSDAADKVAVEKQPTGKPITSSGPSTTKDQWTMTKSRHKCLEDVIKEDNELFTSVNVYCVIHWRLVASNSMKAKAYHFQGYPEGFSAADPYSQQGTLPLSNGHSWGYPRIDPSDIVENPTIYHLSRCRRDNRPHAEPAWIPVHTFRKPLSFVRRLGMELVSKNSPNSYNSDDTKNVPIGGDLTEFHVGQVRHGHVRAWESQAATQNSSLTRSHGI